MFRSFITIFGSRGCEKTSHMVLFDLVITIGACVYIGYLSRKISNIQNREQELLKLCKESNTEKEDNNTESKIRILECGCVASDKDLDQCNIDDDKTKHHVCSKKMDPGVTMVSIDLCPDINKIPCGKNLTDADRDRSDIEMHRKLKADVDSLKKETSILIKKLTKPEKR